MSQARNKIYNYYKQATDEPASITSSSSIWMLGVEHRVHEREGGEGGLKDWTLMEGGEKVF